MKLNKNQKANREDIGTNRENIGTNRENIGTNRENIGTNRENIGTIRDCIKSISTIQYRETKPQYLIIGVQNAINSH